MYVSIRSGMQIMRGSGQMKVHMSQHIVTVITSYHGNLFLLSWESFVQTSKAIPNSLFKNVCDTLFICTWLYIHVYTSILIIMHCCVLHTPVLIFTGI